MTIPKEDITRITGAVEDAVTYPILTKDLDALGAGASGSPGPATGSGSISRLAQETIRSVLGWRYRATDDRGFQAALAKSFQPRRINGHTDWEYTPQTYAVQADLGEITGAQASIHNRAKVAVDHALPLLDGLNPLRTDSDPEETCAMRNIIRGELSELVQELGKVGGPRVQRIESMFKMMLGHNPNLADPENVNGQLGDIRDRFGLVRTRVTTVIEEQNLTNFLILVDYVLSLYQTWRNHKGYFDGSGSHEPYLGTQLVHLSRSLEVIGESVREAYTAMDSVFFGPAERQVSRLEFFGEPPITVAELLGWVESFATTEAPQLLQDGGKDGIESTIETMEQLSNLVFLAFENSKQSPNLAIRGWHSARVTRALQEVHTHLVEAQNLALAVAPVPQVSIPVVAAPRQWPVIDSVIPSNQIFDSHRTSQSIGLTIIGKFLANPSDVMLVHARNLKVAIQPMPNSIVASSDGKNIYAHFDLSGTAAIGVYHVVVVTPEHKLIKARAFELLPPPPEDGQPKDKPSFVEVHQVQIDTADIKEATVDTLNVSHFVSHGDFPEMPHSSVATSQPPPAEPPPGTDTAMKMASSMPAMKAKGKSPTMSSSPKKSASHNKKSTHNRGGKSAGKNRHKR